MTARYYSGEDIVKQLGQLGLDLSAEIGRLGDYESAAVEAEGEFRKAYAEAYRDASGTLEDRKQQAILKTAKPWREWGLAAAVVRRQRESLKALHARIDIGRTMASREKALAALAGRDDAT